MLKNFTIDKNNGLVFLIAALSLANIALKIQELNYFSIIISVIGLLGVVFLFLNKNVFRYFIWIWIIAQVFILEHSMIDKASGVTIIETILDLSQVFKFKLGFSISSDFNTYTLNFNAVVIPYFFLFRNLKTNANIGKTINLLFKKFNLDLQYQDGTFGTITQRVSLDGDDNWLLADLSSPIIFNSIQYNRILVYTEKGLLIERFRLVSNDKIISNSNNLTLDFERVEWIIFD